MQVNKSIRKIEKIDFLKKQMEGTQSTNENQSDYRSSKASQFGHLNTSGNVRGPERRKSSAHLQSDFKQRFQDKQSFMSKEGHIGIVKNATQPIEKMSPDRQAEGLGAGRQETRVKGGP